MMPRRRRPTPEEVRRALAPPPPTVFAVGQRFDFGLVRSETPEREQPLAKVLS
jgi:hypothetical protein